jgi:hypothetical protein
MRNEVSVLYFETLTLRQFFWRDQTSDRNSKLVSTEYEAGVVNTVWRNVQFEVAQRLLHLCPWKLHCLS